MLLDQNGTAFVPAVAILLQLLSGMFCDIAETSEVQEAFHLQGRLTWFRIDS